MAAYLDQYFEALGQLVARVTATQRTAIEQGGAMVADALAGSGVWSVYDTGHLLQHEAHIRAGGLIGLVPFRFEMQVDHPVPRERGKTAPGDCMEREVALALDRSSLRAGDVLLLNSNSGRTANVIELAMQAREQGIHTLGLASAAQMAACDAAHASGKKLGDVVDCFLDNGSPHGDGMIPTDSGEAMCPGSGIASAAILWGIQAHAVDLLEQRGLSPTIYRSVHVSGQDYIDAQLEHYRRQGY